MAAFTPEFLVKASESGVLKCRRQTVKELFNNQNKKTERKRKGENERVLNNKWNRPALRRLIGPYDRPFMRPPADHWISANNDQGPVNRSVPSVSVPWINHFPNSCNLKYQNFISCCFARFTWISTKAPNLHSENDEVAPPCYYLNSIAAWIFTHINICHQGQTQHSVHGRRQSDCAGIIRWPQTLSGGAGHLRSVRHGRCLVGYDNMEWQIVTWTARVETS